MSSSTPASAPVQLAPFMIRSLLSVSASTRQPRSTSPRTSSSGTNTSSSWTSQLPSERMPSFGIGVAVIPSALASQKKTVMPSEARRDLGVGARDQEQAVGDMRERRPDLRPVDDPAAVDRRALVLIAPRTSVPPPGSVSEIANIIRPAAISGRKPLLLLVGPGGAIALASNSVIPSSQ